MRLTLDPIQKIRDCAMFIIDEHYNDMARTDPQRAPEHAAKREEARRVLAGGEPADWFVEAAKIENTTPKKLAELIDSKPNEVAERGNLRRKAVVSLRAATTEQEIEDIVTSVIGQHDHRAAMENAQHQLSK